MILAASVADGAICLLGGCGQSPNKWTIRRDIQSLTKVRNHCVQFELVGSLGFGVTFELTTGVLAAGSSWPAYVRCSQQDGS